MGVEQHRALVTAGRDPRLADGVIVRPRGQARGPDRLKDLKAEIVLARRPYGLVHLGPHLGIGAARRQLVGQGRIVQHDPRQARIGRLVRRAPVGEPEGIVGQPPARATLGLEDDGVDEYAAEIVSGIVALGGVAEHRIASRHDDAARQALQKIDEEVGLAIQHGFIEACIGGMAEDRADRAVKTRKQRLRRPGPRRRAAT